MKRYQQFFFRIGFAALNACSFPFYNVMFLYPMCVIFNMMNENQKTVRFSCTSIFQGHMNKTLHKLNSNYVNLINLQHANFCAHIFISRQTLNLNAHGIYICGIVVLKLPFVKSPVWVNTNE